MSAGVGRSWGHLRRHENKASRLAGVLYGCYKVRTAALSISHGTWFGEAGSSLRVGNPHARAERCECCCTMPVKIWEGLLSTCVFYYMHSIGNRGAHELCLRALLPNIRRANMHARTRFAQAAFSSGPPTSLSIDRARTHGGRGEVAKPCDGWSKRVASLACARDVRGFTKRRPCSPRITGKAASCICKNTAAHESHAEARCGFKTVKQLLRNCFASWVSKLGQLATAASLQHAGLHGRGPPCLPHNP